MLPPSWKAEVQKAIEEAATADKNQREAQQNEASTKITTAINALRDAQAAQTTSEDANEKKNQGVNKATLILVAFTVLFTGLSWWVFHGQLNEMQAEQRPWVYAPDITIAGRIIWDSEHSVYAVPLKFSITNTGHLPAFFVVPKTDARVLKIGQGSFSITNAVCDDFRSSSGKGGATVFAGQTVTHGGFTADDYPKVSKQSWEGVVGDRIIAMFGSVDYQFPAEPGHHQSRFAFAVGTAENQGILERIGALPDDPTSVDVRMLPISINDGIPAN